MSKQTDLINIPDAITVSGSNVGIGTNSPSGKLTVKASDNTYLGGFIIEDSNSTSKSAMTHVDGALFISSNSSNNHLLLDSSGRLGIGTTSPSNQLHLQKSADTGVVIENSAASMATLSLLATGAGRVRSSGVLIFDTGGATERMRITSSGNVGIGTSSVITSTGTNLQVTCTTGNARLVLDNTTTNGQEYRIYSGGAGELSFYNTDNNTERMQISSAGHVFLGGGGFASGASFFAESSSGGTNSYRATTNAGFGCAHYYSNVGGTQTLKAYVATSGTFTTVSDYRIKENVTEITDGISRINALRPVSYNQIGTDLVEDGFLAHELQEVIPHLVTGDKDGLKDDGSMFIQGVNHQGILATLVSAIKEQQETITDLQTEIASLKTRVEALEA